MSEMLDLLAAAPFWSSVLRVATPLILGTLGVLLCERAGVLNLGIEGIMVAGAFTGWLAVYQGGGLWTGVAAAVFVAGILVGADSMSRAVNVPTYIADVIVAVSLLSMLVASMTATYRVVLSQPKDRSADAV